MTDPTRAAGARARAAAGLLLTFFGAAGTLHTAAAQDSLSERLRNRLETAFLTDSLYVDNERLQARDSLRRLYVQTEYRPIWLDGRKASRQAERLLEWIATETGRHGLNPNDYHARVLEDVEGDDRMGALVDFELALSDAFLLLSSHLLAGHLNPETLDPEWRANRRHRDLVPVIIAAAEARRPQEVIADLLPDDPGYARLVEARERLIELRQKGGWPTVSDGPTLKPGESGARVAELAARLAASGDYGGPATEAYDDGLVQAVQAFQRRHGLEPDGVIGKGTLAALNVPVEARIAQTVVNLERWRWLPEDLGERHILVNIAGFSLEVIDGEETAMSMRVVVGRPYRRTPVFSGQISYLVLNPNWEVPSSIAVRDKLPDIRNNPDFFARGGYTLLRGWGADEQTIDPATIDWQAMTPGEFRGYRLRQSPGPLNALGRVKFMFPNEFSVYLHDTPSRELFAKDARSFSSGCIRLEQPLELAEYLLRGQQGWSRADIDAVVATGRERTVTLARKMPVHLLYWTAWVDGEGTVQFRSDIYARDSRVLDNIKAPPPAG